MKVSVVRLLGLLGAAFVLASCHANSSVFTVDTTADTVDSNPGDGFCADASGDCSLRAAVMEANALPGVEEIRLDNGATYTLSIAGAGEDLAATGDLDITEGVVLVGDATIDANGIDRIIDTHHAGGLVEIDGVALTGGTAIDGAAVRTNAAGLTSVLRSHITANVGDAVTHNAGTLYLWNSTLNANTGNAVVADGGTTNLQNTTITANTAAGIAVSGGTAVIKHSTITNNITGIQVLSGTATSTATIVANQTNSIDCAGAVGSGGSNIETATTCGFTGPGDSQNTDPLLGALADNGGRVPTLLPAANSDAIDNAATTDCTLYNTDARDLPRPSGPACDTGAIEIQPVPGDCTPPDLTPGANLRYCDFSGFNLSLADLTGADLTGATLTLANLTGATLDNATLDNASLTDANLSNIAAADASFIGARLTRTNVTGADFATSNLTGVVSQGISTVPASLPAGVIIATQRIIGPGVDLSNALLSEVDFSGVDFSGALLDGATLTSSNLDAANLGSASITGITSGGVVGTPDSLPSGFTLNGGWIVGPGADLIDADLSGLDFTGRDLSDIDFTGADLSNAVFANTNLSYATMYDTNLEGVDLATATMWRLHAPRTNGSPALPPGWALAGKALWGPGVDLRGLTLAPGSTQLTDVSLAGALLSDMSVSLWMTRVDATGADFSRVSAGSSVRVIDSDLSNSSWVDSSVGGSTLITGSNLGGADFTNLRLNPDTSNNRLNESNLEGTIFSGSSLARLAGGGNTGAPIGIPASHQYHNGLLFSISTAPTFRDVDISGFDLSHLEINGTFWGVTAIGTDFSETDITNFTGGSDLTNANLERARITRLTSTELGGANLGEANLLDLRSAWLTGTPSALPFGWTMHEGYLLGPWSTSFVDIDFSNMVLTGADLTGAHFRFPDFSNSVVAFASLRSADLSEADFTDANLFGSDIAGADLTGTIWSNTTCPDGTNSDTNGDSSCVGHGAVDIYEITGDPNGSPYDIAGTSVTLGDGLIKPTLSYVSGATIVEGPGFGVDWYIDGVLFRDDDEGAPFNIASAPTIPTGTTFTGQGTNGSANSFYLGSGNHTITAVAATTVGLVTWNATFRVDPA